MATATIKLIQALRETVKQLSQGADYQWGHMGSCNCGLLAQNLTQRSKDEIHTFAMQKHGDWSEQINDYCPSSGLHMDLLISDLLNSGLSLSDLEQLEKLSNPAVLSLLVPKYGYPEKNNRKHVIAYLEIWAALLEEEFTKHISIVHLQMPQSVTVFSSSSFSEKLPVPQSLS